MEGNNKPRRNWSQDDILQLVEWYQEKEELWNPKCAAYHMKNLKHDAWLWIAKNCSCEVEDVVKKMESLLASFRRERTKIKTSTGTGKGE